MGYFPVRYDSRVVIYERKMFIRLATGLNKVSNSASTTQRLIKVPEKILVKWGRPRPSKIASSNNSIS